MHYEEGKGLIVNHRDNDNIFLFKGEKGGEREREGGERGREREREERERERGNREREWI